MILEDHGWWMPFKVSAFISLLATLEMAKDG